MSNHTTVNDQTTAWWHSATFYAIYPLGFCDAPPENPSVDEADKEPAGAGFADAAPPVARIDAITDDLDRIGRLGFSALYLGPLFESGSHGYDTHDYFHLDRRLGNDDDLARLVDEAHARGMHVVVDGVYNHVGRGFWAFDRLRREGRDSEFRSWFRGVDFGRDNRFGDGFVYEGWEGVEELVSLNHADAGVREHLLAAACHAVERFGFDGIRLDVAYLLPFDFLRDLAAGLHAVRPDAWLMGEVIHGDYPAFLDDGRLDSITNYECYKGLWSSFNDRNLHEIGHSLRRLFGPSGLLVDTTRAGKLPYSFADNHDVSRVAAVLDEPGHLFPLYGLLWTMPGIPSVYYGSEYGMKAGKEDGDDALRPPRSALSTAHELAGWISDLNAARARSTALRRGSYHEVQVASTQLVFERSYEDELVLMAVNAEKEPVTVDLPAASAGGYESLLGGDAVEVASNHPQLALPAYGTVILRRRG